MSSQDRPVVRHRRWWWIVAGFLVVTATFVLVNFVGTFMIGLFLYYAARPFSRRFERYLDSSATAGAASVLFIVLPFVVVFAGVLLAAIAQLAAIRTEDLTALLGYLFPDADLAGIPRDPVEFVRQLADMAGAELIRTLFDTLVTVGATFLTVGVNALLAVLFAFYLLRDDRELKQWFTRELADDESPLGRYATAVDRDLQTVFFGTIVTIFVVIVAAAVIYTLLNLIAPSGLAIPQPILLAVVTGVATLVPVFGRASVYLLVAAWLTFVAVTSVGTAGLWFPALFLGVMILGLDQVVQFGVQPYFSGQTVHTGLMLFALGIGTVLFGWYGVFLGPVLLVVNYEFVRLVLPELVHGESLSESPEPTTTQTQLPTGDEETPTGTASAPEDGEASGT